MEHLINSLFTNDISIPAKTIIIAEGTFTDKFYLVKKGAVRAWYKNATKEVTSNLVFEDNLFTSLESFLFNSPSIYNFETLENCELGVVTKAEFDDFLNSHKDLKDKFYQNLLRRALENNKRFIIKFKLIINMYSHFFEMRVFVRMCGQWSQCWLVNFLKSTATRARKFFE